MGVLAKHLAGTANDHDQQSHAGGGGTSGSTIYRGYQVNLPDDIANEIRRLTEPPTDETQIGMSTQVGPLVVRWLQENHWDADMGLGRHWSTRPEMAEAASMQGGAAGGWNIILSAKYNTADVNPALTGTTALTAESESEVNLLPSGKVTVTDVRILGLPSNAPLLDKPIVATVGRGVAKHLAGTANDHDQSSHAGGGGTDTDYRGQHTSPDRDYGAPAHDMAGFYPDDVYTPQGLRYYRQNLQTPTFDDTSPNLDGNTQTDLDKFAWQFLQDVRSTPKQMVPIYRAVPLDAPDRISPNDWVTISREYARDHGISALQESFKIVSGEVPAKDLFTNGDSWLEWGWDPEGSASPIGSTSHAVSDGVRVDVSTVTKHLSGTASDHDQQSHAGGGGGSVNTVADAVQALASKTVTQSDKNSLLSASRFRPEEAGFDDDQASIINDNIYTSDVPEILYHVAPSSARESIDVSGLFAQSTWNTGSGGGIEYRDEALWQMGEDGELFPFEYRPEGVYLFREYDAAVEYRGSSLNDIYVVNARGLVGEGGQIVRDPVSAHNWDYLLDEEQTFVTRVVPSSLLQRIGGNSVSKHLAGTQNDHNQQSHAGGGSGPSISETSTENFVNFAVAMTKGSQFQVVASSEDIVDDNFILDDLSNRRAAKYSAMQMVASEMTGVSNEELISAVQVLKSATAQFQLDANFEVGALEAIAENLPGDTGVVVFFSNEMRLPYINVYERSFRDPVKSALINATNFDPESGEVFAGELREPAIAEQINNALKQTVVSALIHEWAQSSNGTEVSVLVQHAAQKEFGLDSAVTPAANSFSYDGYTESDVGALEKVARSFARAQYTATQKALSEQFPNQTHFALHRGGDRPEYYRELSGTAGKLQDATLALRPLASFSTGYSIARIFGLSPMPSQAPTAVAIKPIFSAAVPKERIFSTPLTGNGALHEQEFVVLGGPITGKALFNQSRGFKEWERTTPPSAADLPLGATEFITVNGQPIPIGKSLAKPNLEESLHNEE